MPLVFAQQHNEQSKQRFNNIEISDYDTYEDLDVDASVPLQNFVGKLEETCCKKSFTSPKYTECGSENGEYVIKCEMFDTMRSWGCSRNKKDSKQKAAEKMLKLISEIPQNDITVSLEQNFVGKLQETCCKKLFTCPKYTECGTENGEYVIKCEMFDTMSSRGYSRNKKDAKQKAAEKMLKMISEILQDDISISLEQNFVGILEETWGKKSFTRPKYTECRTENGEYVITCEMFDNMRSRGYSRNKKDAKQRAAEKMLKMISEIPQNDISVSLEQNLAKLGQNHVGILNDMCKNNMLEPPKYSTEGKNENGEFISRCEVALKQCNKVLISRGESGRKKIAKQKAAENMVEILMNESSFLEHKNWLESVNIIDNSSKSEGMPVENLDIVRQSDLSSVANMNVDELKRELQRLKVIYCISPIEGTNVLMLKTSISENYKQLFTFVSADFDNLRAKLNVLRQAVFGLRVLKR